MGATLRYELHQNTGNQQATNRQPTVNPNMIMSMRRKYLEKIRKSYSKTTRRKKRLF